MKHGYYFPSRKFYSWCERNVTKRKKEEKKKRKRKRRVSVASSKECEPPFHPRGGHPLYTPPHGVTLKVCA